MKIFINYKIIYLTCNKHFEKISKYKGIEEKCKEGISSDRMV